MSLPYSYKNSFAFDTKFSIEEENLLNLFYSVISNDNSFKNINLANGKLNFKSKKSLLNFFYNVECSFNTDNNKIKINYKINLVEVIIISLFLFVFIPFFSRFSLNGFFLFSIIFILLFYFSNVLFIIHQLRQYFTKILETNNIISEIELTDEQINWINSPYKCPACGCDINENTIFCPDCGLKISQNPYTKPLDLSKKEKPNNNNITYHYNEKK